MSLLDKKDTRIIEMLEENGRKPLKEIAKQMDLSEAAIRKRIHALQRNGVIKKFTIKVDNTKIGLNTVAIVGINVEPTKMLDIAQRLCEFRELKCVATSSGDHMIMMEIWTKDGRELTKLISEKIGTMEGVKEICPAMILEKLKD